MKPKLPNLPDLSTIPDQIIDLSEKYILNYWYYWIIAIVVFVAYILVSFK